MMLFPLQYRSPASAPALDQEPVAQAMVCMYRITHTDARFTWKLFLLIFILLESLKGTSS